MISTFFLSINVPPTETVEVVVAFQKNMQIVALGIPVGEGTDR